MSVQIVGGGPAGSAAAIAALSECRTVHIFEKSSFPRHKVCGEFLSPEIAPLLEALGIWQEFLRLRPVPIRRTILHFGKGSSESQLPDGAFGLSRYEFDRLMFEKAIALGATTTRERVTASNCTADLSNCRRAVRRPFYLASCLRAIVEAGLAQSLGPLIPAGTLFRMTRSGALVA